MASTSQPEKLILAAAVLATTTLLILLSPAPTATATEGPDAIIPYRHVHIVNQFEINLETLFVHCQSKDDDLGFHYIDFGTEFTWKFRPTLLGRTQFWCYVAPVKTPAHMQFDAYIYHDPSIIEYKNNVYWIIKDDGVYLEILLDQYQVKEYVWARWSIS
ncbi:S-protein homolog 1 [Linum grandiflorum]